MSSAIEGLDALVNRLERLREFCESPPPSFMNDAANYMINSVRTNFDQGGRPKWTPRKRTYPHPPLMKTKALYRSIGEVQRIHGGEIEVGTNCTYAGYQHDGTKKNGRQAIDPRPFFVWQDTDIRYIEKSLTDEIERIL